MGISNAEIGKRISECRKKLEISRAELGAMVNLHETTVKKYEDGDIKNPSIEVIESFASALNTSPLFLAGWENISDSSYAKYTFDESSFYNINSKTYEYCREFVSNFFSDLITHMPNVTINGEKISDYYESSSSLNSLVSTAIIQTKSLNYSMIYKEIFTDLKQMIIKNNITYSDEFRFGQFNGLSNEEIIEEIVTSIDKRLKNIMYETLKFIFTNNIIKNDSKHITWDNFLETYLKNKNIFKESINPYLPDLLQAVKAELLERLNFETIKDIYYKLTTEQQNIVVKHFLDLPTNEIALKG